MGKCVFRDGRVIEDYGKPYFVAEMNSSHNGNIETAKKMIDAAVDCGCDGVKFQSWSADSLYSKSYYKKNPIAKRFVDKFSLRPEQLKELAFYCQKEKNIGFSSTPYSEEEVDFLVEECNVPYIKIASMELNNHAFLKYIGGKNVPIVLSTGMGDFDEIKSAVRVLEISGCEQMVLLHCVSIYPTLLETVNLNNILGLRDEFARYAIGFSDHTVGDAAAIASIALGASLIEKHLTLDHTKVGMDNGMATEPIELKNMIDKCRTVQIALGTKNRIVPQEELEQRRNMRRSIIAVRKLSAGTIITDNDLAAKRPGIGFSPDKIELLIGKKLIRDVDEDSLIVAEDIEI